MEFKIAKTKFIEKWGELALDWGISKTMGHIHALLLTSPQALHSDQIMKALEISRGNVNQNIRNLLDWELVNKVNVKGERKDFYSADKDFLEIFKKVIKHRKQKELSPLINLLKEINQTKSICHESSEFCKMTKELSLFAFKAEQALDNLVNSETNWMIKNYLRMIR